jgi:hypothetical protein
MELIINVYSGYIRATQDLSREKKNVTKSNEEKKYYNVLSKEK